MKSVFEKAARDELKDRINSLNENSPAQWGKMNVAQMVKHCNKWDEMALGKEIYKQAFIGRLFGKMALKNIMKDEPMKRNMPTVPSFKITEDVDLAQEKRNWVALLDEYEHYPINSFIHPFFGVMKKEETGYMVYKHADHHLKQFNS